MYNLRWLDDNAYLAIDGTNALCKLFLCSFQLSNMGKMGSDVRLKSKEHISDIKESVKNPASAVSSW